MIRPMDELDLEWVREERNLPECRDYFRQHNLLSRENQREWWERVKKGEFIPFVIQEYGGLVGVVQLSHIDNIARKCEFSIMIRPESRGKGYGKKALWELLKHAFNDLNMNQVYSDVFETNTVIDTYLRWGFKEFGILPKWYYKNGRYIDSHIIAITKDEYNNSLKKTLPR